ncbi:type II toxin-antitoxin system VapC family toxin [Sphingomonas adhaesiva]|uniref:type II toxin-antitoxin system VapC family toxin n=1 Tax=Sphingomonas adhaesiva TaxID=28212 RepID=UPI002FFA41AB
MKAVDTNILARIILQDDARQTAIAADILRHPVWISLSVWTELGWLLFKRLKLQRDVVAEALSTLLMMETVRVADAAGLSWAIERFRSGADWADMVHLIAARGAADTFVTFDAGVAPAASGAPVSVETLA